MRVGLASGSARSRAAGAWAARRSLPLLIGKVGAPDCRRLGEIGPTGSTAGTSGPFGTGPRAPGTQPCSGSPTGKSEADGMSQRTPPEWVRSHRAFLVAALATALWIVTWVIVPWPYVLIPLLPLDALSIAALLAIGAIARLVQAEARLRDVELGVLLMLGLSNLVAVAGGGPLPTGELLWVMVVYLVAGVSVTVALGFAVGGSLLRRMR